MSLFLAGVPGKLAKLVTRLAPSGYAQTLTDARVSALDNLNATVSSRAPSSTALSSAMWTDTKAGYLDAAISSAKIKPQANFIRDLAVTTSVVAVGAGRAEGIGSPYTAGALSAGVYSPLLDITTAGYLWMVVTYRESSFSSATLSTRITIDGDVWDVVTDTGGSTALTGHVAHGVMSGTDAAPVLVPMMVRFSASLKVEIASSVGQTSSKATARILYSLDT